MSEPSGEIVARPLVKRGCGCVQEFQYYAVDRYRAQRLAKFQQTRCPACVAKLQDERRQLSLPPKAEAFKMLPVGAAMTVTAGANGVWAGTLTAAGVTVEHSEPTDGPQSLILALTRLWISSTRPPAPPAAPAAATAPAETPAAPPPAPKPAAKPKTG